jgi:hypothetical protein
MFKHFLFQDGTIVTYEYQKGHQNPVEIFNLAAEKILLLPADKVTDNHLADLGHSLSQAEEIISVEALTDQNIQNKHFPDQVEVEDTSRGSGEAKLVYKNPLTEVIESEEGDYAKASLPLVLPPANPLDNFEPYAVNKVDG